MILVSAEAINRKAPYKVIQVDDMSVRFVTRMGVRYIVGFTPDAFIFDENGYEFYIINESEPAKQDPLLFDTIVAIVENLFHNTRNSAMIYICAPDNHQQAVRARMFSIWFERADDKQEYTLQTYDSHDDGVDYYYGLILRRDNPDHDRLIDIFLDFLHDY